MSRANDPREVDAQAREQLAEAADALNRDRLQLSTPEGRRWFYELLERLGYYRDPGVVDDGQLREWFGRWRVGNALHARMWNHPQLARLTLEEQAARTAHADQVRQAKAAAAETQRRARGLEASDYAP